LFKTLGTPVTEEYVHSASGQYSKAFDGGCVGHQRKKSSLSRRATQMSLPKSSVNFSNTSLPLACSLCLYSALLIPYGLGCLLSRNCTLTQTLSCPFSALWKFTSCLKTNSPAHCMKLHFKRAGQGHYFTMSEVYIRDYLRPSYMVNMWHAMSPINNMKGALLNVSVASNNCRVKGSIIIKM
jgi:hypothetical protein